MEADQAWRVITSERLSLADMLEDLTPEQWDSPSLCSRWRARDVAAHVALAPQMPSARSLMAGAVRARGSFHRLNHDLAVGHANRPTAQLVAELRTHAASRDLPIVTTYRNILFDVLVHGQDIAIPLGIPRTMPTEAACAGATRVWSMGWPFHAQRSLGRFTLTATDAQWTVGTGPAVLGPVEALLLLLTGRPAALPRLSGPGLDELTAQMARGSRS